MAYAKVASTGNGLILVEGEERDFRLGFAGVRSEYGYCFQRAQGEARSGQELIGGGAWM